MIEFAEVAKPKFDTWTKSALDSFSQYQQQVQGEFKRLNTEFTSEMTETINKNQEAYYKKYLKTLTGAERGVLVRKKSTAEPLLIEPTLEDLFKPQTKYFPESVYNPGTTGAKHLGRAFREYADWDNHLRGKPKQHEPEVPIGTLAGNVSKYDKSFPRYKLGQTELGTGEVIGHLGGEEVLLAPLSMLNPDHIMEDMKMRPMPAHEFKAHIPQLHIDFSAPVHLLEDIAHTPMRPILSLEETPFETPTKSKKRRQRRKSRKSKLGPRRLEYDQLSPKGKEKMLEQHEAIVDNILDTTDAPDVDASDVSADFDAYDYLIEMVSPSPRRTGIFRAATQE